MSAASSDWKEHARGLQPHPIAELFPLIQGQEYVDLCGSIDTHGLLQPIVIDAENRIIDGRNRLRACLDKGVQPRYVSFDSLDFEGEERDYIAAVNLHRRQLTDDQRVQIAALIFKDYREIAKAKQAEQLKQGESRVNESVNTGKAKPTAVKVAEVAHVSQHKAQQALKVVADAPEMAQKVAAGEVKLAKAAKVAEKKNPPKQRAKNGSKAPKTVEKPIDLMALLRKTADAISVKKPTPAEAEQVALMAVQLIIRMAPLLQGRDRQKLIHRLTGTLDAPGLVTDAKQVLEAAEAAAA